MASSLDGSASNSLEIVSIMSVDENREPNKRRRKNPNPRHLNTYLITGTNTPVETSETQTNSKGKKVSLKTNSDVSQMKKKNTSCGEKLLVSSKETVTQNVPMTPQFWSNRSNVDDREDRPHADEKVLKNTATSCGFGLEQCVKLMRQLERSGYVDSHFRQKFLTWFSLRATAEERNTVKAFVHAFEDDAIALAEQLVHTFSDCILLRKGPTIGHGDEGCGSNAFCKKPRR